MKPVLFGCAGLELSPEEYAFFAESNPFGFILFQRNCAAPDQVRRLTTQLRACVGREDAPIFIDQEGGRVARLKPPHWESLPALRRIGEMYENNPAQGMAAMRDHTIRTAQMLIDVGINGNCSPVLDLYIDGASSAIGDRAISRNPDVVAKLAQVIVDTFLANGVYPVIKHLPGHGRVKVDPHYHLPIVEEPRSVLEAEDFTPFIALHDAPIGMNCHVLFTALDADYPVSLSKKIHDDIIRGAIGFNGLIFSDDLAMKALKASPAENALRTLNAGSDIALYCPGLLPEMKAIADAVPDMAKEAAHRWQQAQKKRG